ncbi:MAG: hypothetical protein ACO3CV_03775 [Steroidobacteraceae bacterium]|jgi:hypothetical protein
MAKAKKSGRKARNVAQWSAADEAKLRKLAGKMSTAKIAKALRRSVAAITFKAFALRLSLRQKNSNRGRRIKVSKR